VFDCRCSLATKHPFWQQFNEETEVIEVRHNGSDKVTSGNTTTMANNKCKVYRKCRTFVFQFLSFSPGSSDDFGEFFNVIKCFVNIMYIIENKIKSIVSEFFFFL
jgi:hypothetical protein